MFFFMLIPDRFAGAERLPVWDNVPVGEVVKVLVFIFSGFSY